MEEATAPNGQETGQTTPQSGDLSARMIVKD
jgi:hypothetical protein